ncbi:MFS transporter [Actinoplanes sp. NPDC051494]|uniref:MFS transporter n=1 Tax=Actinoplanes sp. NPDC051494 TaxID=3363907 RepID=UPI0037BAAFBA
MRNTTEIRRWDYPAVAAGLLAGALGVVWAGWLARNSGDLTAQYAWTDFVRRHPGSAYNFSWYGGMHPMSYSAVSPYLMALIGVRTTGVLACIASAVLGGLLVSRSGIGRPLVPALWLALAVWGNLATGRVTYLLGMVFVLAAAIAVLPGPVLPGTVLPGTGRRAPRPVLAALFGTVATLCSPVAGLFVAVLAAALFLTGRRRPALWLAPGPPLVIGATTLLFPFSGVQPFPLGSALLTCAAAASVAVLTPRSWRTVRAGAWVYCAGAALCWLLPTPIGSNVQRLALLGAAAILIGAAVLRERTGRWMVATYVATAGLVVWTVVQPVNDYTRMDAVADARPLLAELRQLGAERGRVEVVPLRTHGEAFGVAPHVNLARGWNRQADAGRNPLFYDGTLTAATYRDWLRTWGVGYVVLPSAKLDGAGIAEARIVAAGPSWLSPVWQNPDWRVYRVEAATGLAGAPATVTRVDPASVTVRMPGPGSTVLRVAWSPWLTVEGACLARRGEWTELVTPAAGTFTVEARYTPHRGAPCDR